MLEQHADELATAAGLTLTAEGRKRLPRSVMPVVEVLADGLVATAAGACTGGKVKLDLEEALARVLRRSGGEAVGMLRRVLERAEGSAQPRRRGGK
jgi:hypothetical protein